MRNLDTTGRSRVIDPRYMSLCVEQTDYRPILFERARDRFNEQMEQDARLDQWDSGTATVLQSQSLGHADLKARWE